jgi:hypothetical protein
MLDIPDLQLLPGIAKIDEGASRAPAGHGRDLVGRELAIDEDVQHLPPDIAGRADHDHPITHFLSPFGKAQAYARLPPA